MFNKEQEMKIRLLAGEEISANARRRVCCKRETELYLALPKYSLNLKLRHCCSSRVGVVEHEKYEWEFSPDYGNHEERVIKRACK